MRSEMLVISGAVGGAASKRARDLLKELGEVDISRVAMHPGSVQGFGLLGDARIPTFLLPSNPVSALVSFEIFVRPSIRAALGKNSTRRRHVRARALGPIASKEGRRGYVRARLMRDADTQDYLVEGLSGATGAPAHLLAGMSEANALIRIPEPVGEVRPGDVVDVLFLGQGS
ncbi:molybdopterin molybdenumtransferase [Corynebacterium hindlerae]|nr:molybdopterin molybdenumtransferase [Corynebacterium hindlerae]